MLFGKNPSAEMSEKHRGESARAYIHAQSTFSFHYLLENQLLTSSLQTTEVN